MHPDGRYEVCGLAPGNYQISAFPFDFMAYSNSLESPSFRIVKDQADPAQVDLELEAKEVRYGRALYADGSPAYPGSWTAWFEKYDQDKIQQNHGQTRRTISQNLARDGSFHVGLLRLERDDLVKNSQDMIEIEVYGQGSLKKIAEVPFDKLSKDRAKPYQLVIAGKAPEKADTKHQPDTTTLAQPEFAAAPPPPASRKTEAKERNIVSFELVATDGRTHRLSDYQGKPVLLNIFTTWCGPCQQELPHLLEMHERYAKRGLVILAVSRHEEPEAVESYARRKRLPFPILVDLKGDVIKQFADKNGELAVPTNVLLDRHHRVALTDVGFTTETVAKLKEAVGRLLQSD
jgi:peroxiredoxin